MESATLVKGFAFDLGFTVMARHCRYQRIADAPVRIDHKFHNTISPRAVFQVLWDPLANFYQLRILNWHDRAQPWGWSLLLEGLPTPLGGG